MQRHLRLHVLLLIVSARCFGTPVPETALIFDAAYYNESAVAASLLQTGLASISRPSFNGSSRRGGPDDPAAAVQIAPIAECTDVEDFRDAHGFYCWQWRRHSCDKAVEEYEYEQWQQTQLLESCAFSCRTCKPSAAELSGVHQNRDGDLKVFVTATVTNVSALLICVCLFYVFSRWYPEVYRHNVDAKTAPEPPNGFLGWLWASLTTSTEEAERIAGLDAAMLIRFSEFGLKLCFCIGLPTCLLIPLHLSRGHATQVDKLSKIAMANVIDDHPWLYWLHVLCVWNVVFCTCYLIYKEWTAFLPRRYKWLAQQPPPIATTVMVEGISRPYRSDAKLKEFFSEVFEGKVKSAYVVKKTGTLSTMVQTRSSLRSKVRELKLEISKQHGDEVKKSKEAEEKEAEIDSLNKSIKEERARINKLAPNVGGVNSHSGFVTFKSSKEAQLARSGLCYGSNSYEWLVSSPPEPGSVIWEELQKDRGLLFVKQLLGYALTGGIYLMFVPVCIGCTSLAYMVEIKGPLAVYWAAFVPTMGLLLFVNFLPTVFLLIFRTFFNLKSDQFAQHQLQIWYFWFQVVFVILVAAIGQSVLEFFGLLVTSPLSIFEVLSEELPKTTHFYMNFLVLQLMSHGMNLTRYINLAKYLVFRKLYDPKEAHEKSEPEDQDYYGMGGRSARWTILLLIAIVFSTLSPLMAPLGFVVFAVMRAVYGYLLVFAETPKVDLGGVFFVTKLRHLQLGVMIYLALMIGVLAVRPFSTWPLYFSLPTLPVMIVFYRAFSDYEWERLPMSELGSATEKGVKDSGQRYFQMELSDDADAS